MPGAPRLVGDNPRYERWRWQIFGITWLAYAGFYLTRKSFSVAKIELAKPEVLGLSDGDLARIDGAFLIAYAIGQSSENCG
jgi:OPA family sugar phosphate sensor protein UhpC-like MFS transporter